MNSKQRKTNKQNPAKKLQTNKQTPPSKQGTKKHEKSTELQNARENREDWGASAARPWLPDMIHLGSVGALARPRLRPSLPSAPPPLRSWRAFSLFFLLLFLFFSPVHFSFHFFIFLFFSSCSSFFFLLHLFVLFSCFLFLFFFLYSFHSFIILLFLFFCSILFYSFSFLLFLCLPLLCGVLFLFGIVNGLPLFVCLFAYFLSFSFHLIIIIIISFCIFSSHPISPLFSILHFLLIFFCFSFNLLLLLSPILFTPSSCAFTFLVNHVPCFRLCIILSACFYCLLPFGTFSAFACWAFALLARFAFAFIIICLSFLFRLLIVTFSALL